MYPPGISVTSVKLPVHFSAQCSSLFYLRKKKKKTIVNQYGRHKCNSYLVDLCDPLSMHYSDIYNNGTNKCMHVY
jgi:hypothetical protein